MRKAFVHVRETPPYRNQNLIRGLARLGYQVEVGEPKVPLTPEDVCVIWNKHGRSHQSVQTCARYGAALIIVENGYYGKDRDGIQYYAMALDGHNGSGRWYVGDEVRLKHMNIKFKPWRTEGKHLLIADQRGIGSKLMRSPNDFGDRMVQTLHDCGRQVILRRHPGRHAPTQTVAEQLKNCWAVVVWSSNLATEALIAGVPVLHSAPYIVTHGAAKKFSLDRVANPKTPDRQEAFVRMSWAQWSVEEIGSGQAFRTLIDVHAGRLPSCQDGAGI